MASKAELRRALKQSIEHWYTNLSCAWAGFPADVEIYSKGCALCKACGFEEDNGMPFFTQDCTLCPVSWRTHRRMCINSPWTSVNIERETAVLDGVFRKGKFIKAIEKEIHFLESLEV